MAVQNNMLFNDDVIEEAVIRDIPGDKQDDIVFENVIKPEKSEEKAKKAESHPLFRRFLPSRVLAVFCRQWSVIIHSGASSLNALKIVREQTESRSLKKALDRMIRKIGMGVPIGETMSQAGIFPEDFVKCVERADETGKLEECLKMYADVFDRRQKQSSLRNYMTRRPLMIFLLAIILILSMLSIIYPKFINLFNGTGVEIEGMTKTILKISLFIGNYWYIIILILVAVYVAIRMYGMTDSGRRVASSVSLNAPFSGVVKKKHVLSDVARSLGVMLSEGYDTSEALRVLSQTYGDEEYIRLYLGRASVNIQSGITLSHALSDAGFFPPVFTQMLSVGEEMGNIVDMLFEIADYYDSEADKNADRSVAILEPAIIIGMAIIMFLIIISLTEPVTTLYDFVRNM